MDPKPLPLILAPESNTGELLTKKIDAARAAGLEKRAAMAGRSPAEQLRTEFLQDVQTKTQGELATTYAPALLNEYNQAQDAQQRLEATASRSRTSSELTKDIPLSLLRGAVNLGAGIPLLTEKLSYGGANALTQLGAMGLNATGLISDDTANNIQRAASATEAAVLGPQERLLGQFNDWSNRAASDVKQADQAVMAQENAAVDAQHQADYEAALARGDNAALAGVKCVL